MDLRDSLAGLQPSPSPSDKTLIEGARLRALIVLEANSLERQYHQANVLVMARVWQHYLGFTTGMILALVGAAFILGKLREPASTLTTELANNSLSFKSASPGLVLAVLGTILMFTTIVTHHTIEVVHNAIYLHDTPQVAPDDVEPPPLRRPKEPPAGNTAPVPDPAKGKQP